MFSKELPNVCLDEILVSVCVCVCVSFRGMASSFISRQYLADHCFLVQSVVFTKGSIALNCTCVLQCGIN